MVIKMIKKISKNIWIIGGGTWYGTAPAYSEETDCNVYLIKAGSNLLLIDSGSRQGKLVIEKNMEEAGFKPEDITDILLTHSHYDHCDSLSRWQSQGNSNLHMSDIGAEYIKKGDHRLISYQIVNPDDFPDYVFSPFKVDHQIKDGETFGIDSLKIKAYAMPGHTPDSMIFETKIEEEKIWISGDIVFGKDKRTGKLGCIGWVNILWQSDLTAYKNSLEKMLSFPTPDVLLPGHGFTVASKNNIRKVMEASLQTVESMLKDPNTRHTGLT